MVGFAAAAAVGLAMQYFAGSGTTAQVGRSHALLLLAALLAFLWGCGFPHLELRPPVEHSPPDEGRATGVEVVGVALLVLLIYWPPFLARYGPFGEDAYFLSAVQRVIGGQRPFADFEFIYGPLLIVPLGAWLKAFGFALAPYYWFLALVEAVTYVCLLCVLARWLPERRHRLAVLVMVAALVINDNLGLSYLAIRRLLPIAVLALSASQRGGTVLAAVALGIQVNLSVEYALAATVGLGAMGGVAALVQRDGRPLARAVLTGTLGLGLGLGLGAVLLGRATQDWLSATTAIVLARGGGEAGFPFQVTVNVVAVFALVLWGAFHLGSGTRSREGRAVSGGDLFLVGSVVYALVAMRSGLARADMYHLVPPVLGLVVFVLVGPQGGRFAIPVAARALTSTAAILVVVTYVPGLIGAARTPVTGWLRGARDVLGGRVAVSPAGVARGPRIPSPRVEVEGTAAAVAQYLAEPARSSRPVVFYGALWGLDRLVGVSKPSGLYPVDDYLMSDDVGAGVRGYLEKHGEALVLVNAQEWERLRGAEVGTDVRPMFWLRGRRGLETRFLEWWSSAHYGLAPLDEVVRKRERWAHTVGFLLVERYVEAARFGNVIVLRRSDV